MDVGVSGSKSPEGCLAKGNACLARQVPFEEDLPDFLNVLLDLLTVKVSIGRGSVDHLLPVSSLLLEPSGEEFDFGTCTFTCLQLVTDESSSFESTLHSIDLVAAHHLLEDILDGIEHLLRVHRAMLDVIEAVLVGELSEEDSDGLSRVLRGEWQIGKIDEMSVALSAQVEMANTSSEHLFYKNSFNINYKTFKKN